MFLGKPTDGILLLLIFRKVSHQIKSITKSAFKCYKNVIIGKSNEFSDDLVKMDSDANPKLILKTKTLPNVKVVCHNEEYLCSNKHLDIKWQQKNVSHHGF